MADELSALQVIAEAYQQLDQKSRASYSLVLSPREFRTEVFGGSAGVGYMTYDLVRVHDFNSRWAILLGIPDDVARRDFSVDLVAFKPKKDLKAISPDEARAEVLRGVRNANYFNRSLVYALANGDLSCNERGAFGCRVLELIDDVQPSETLLACSEDSPVKSYQQRWQDCWLMQLKRF